DWVAAGARRMRGRRVLAEELAAKGVDPELIQEALSGVDPADDREVALEFARRKSRGMAGLDPQVRFRRLCAALERRGFPRGSIVAVVREVLDEAGAAAEVEG
ncbi:MAG: RecX family transcriptional regulator, partial [Propionicimonas sp.]